MIVKAVKFNKFFIIFILLIILSIILGSIFFFKSFAEEMERKQEEKKYIKWVDFNVPLELLEKTSKLDIDSHNKNEEIKINWIELLSYLGAKYGGNFKQFKQKDLDDIVARLKSGENMSEIAKDMKLYSYYIEAYTAILDEFIGNYKIEGLDENQNKVYKEKYGIKAFLPIAKNYAFSHYDDFGNSRSYGYKRVHLGNDLMGAIGTPIIAVESGIVEACG